MDIERDLNDPEETIRLFDEEEKYQSFVALINRLDCPVTGFVVTSLLGKYGKAFSKLQSDIPIEYEVHSHTHNLKQPCSKQEIYDAREAYTDFFKTPPKGYRAPNGLISQEGIRHLIDSGYQYDASIFPSLRVDEYGYSNLNLPSHPFKIKAPQGSVLELPFASLDRIRLVYSLSFIKLLGIGTYRLLMNFFPLPNIVILDTHPYDFYIRDITQNIPGWKKFAHLRNSRNAARVFEKIVLHLRKQGYTFMQLSEVYGSLMKDPALPELPLSSLNAFDTNKENAAAVGELS